MAKQVERQKEKYIKISRRQQPGRQGRKSKFPRGHPGGGAKVSSAGLQLVMVLPVHLVLMATQQLTLVHPDWLISCGY